MSRRPAGTLRQASARARYDGYIGSEAWTRRRRQWLWAERQSNDGQVLCAVCGTEWGTPRAGGELHHLTYDRLGAERHEDLVALCSRCHRRVELLFVQGGYARLRSRTVGMRAALRALQEGERRGEGR